MNREEIIEQQNAYYMAGYPSRRSENKMNKEHYQLTKAKEIIREFMKYEITEYDGSLEIHFEKLKKKGRAILERK